MTSRYRWWIGTLLFLSTDVREYFEEIRDLIPSAGGLREAVDPLFPMESPEGRTSYESKYLEAGRPIYRASYMCPPPP